MGSFQQHEDRRLQALHAWLRDMGVDVATVRPASDDASFRRYFRCQLQGKSFIAMDAPPDKEDSQPFVDVAGYLETMGLHAARVLQSDLDNGFLLLSDLGSVQYLDVLRDQPQRADALYGDALAALATMQSAGAKFQQRLPPYDETLLRFELSLFSDWLCGTHLGLQWDDRDQAAWQACCDLLVDNALQQPRVFVHRDFHSRNLMVLEQGGPGILDFQDAVEGPYTYDLVSLLKDCYVRWPAPQVEAWAQQYYLLARDAHAGLNEDTFRRHFSLMGVQRHLKAAGIFCRLNHRDGKSRYLQDVPPTLDYVVAASAEFEALDWLRTLLMKRVLPAWASSL